MSKSTRFEIPGWIVNALGKERVLCETRELQRELRRDPYFSARIARGDVKEANNFILESLEIAAESEIEAWAFGGES